VVAQNHEHVCIPFSQLEYTKVKTLELSNYKPSRILSKFDLNFDVKLLIIHTPRLPCIKIDGTLPSMKHHVTKEKIGDILKITNANMVLSKNRLNQKNPKQENLQLPKFYASGA